MTTKTKIKKRFPSRSSSVPAAGSFRADFRRRMVAALVIGAASAVPVKYAWAADMTNAVPAKVGPAKTAAAKSDKDLMSLDLTALANTKVTSVSLRAENAFDVPSAITVLNNEDIRRSGATSIPEALRLVPGMDVARVDSSTWATSARGFDEIYSRSMLVLVDGRTVYVPFNGGVVWDLQEQMLNDLDRIEVIRGPGGAIWGANAVNGVINIVSKSARDTQGLLLYSGGGSADQLMEGARYGGKLGENTYYRVFGDYRMVDSFDAPGGGSAHTGYQGGQGGFRMDSYANSDATHLTWQGDFTYNDLLDATARDYNVNTLGRWTHNLSERSSVQVQAYFDRTTSDAWGGINLGVNTYDISAQQNISLGSRNNMVWGAGYRLWTLDLKAISDPSLVIDPNFSEQRADVFAQDSFNLIPDKLTVTGGLKLEYDDITGIEYEPSVRAAFTPTKSQTLWGAITRSVLMPTLKAGHNGYRQPDNIGALNTYDLGNPNIRSAPVWTYELGYRIQPIKRVSADIALYFNQYSELQNQVQTGNFYTWENSFSAETFGGEASVTLQPVDQLRVSPFYSYMKIYEWGPVPDTDVLHGSPEQQAGLQVDYDFTKQVSLDGQLRYVDRVAGASAYTTADLRVSYRPTRNLELAVAGQNLFQPQHLESGDGVEVPRGVYGKITFKF